ncbi:MAG: ABC transporter substrate-binding protein [Flavobacteriaceae bacterium]|nr:ABC transporter substrate-binding protein [Flavobacteriaceae bacterium]
MIRKYALLSFIVLFTFCKKEPKVDQKLKTSVIQNDYAKGFEVMDYGEFKVLHITNPWPNADITYKYALLPEGKQLPDSVSVNTTISVPLEKIVVTSTTHIPALEALGVEKQLVGFPNTNYVSSEKTRQLIDQGAVKELGKNESINTEVLLKLKPDAVVGFAVDGNNKTFNTIEKSGIPVLFNADWTEGHPLGKAEWIKFFGYLFGKEKEAQEIFKKIANDYNEAKELAATIQNNPTVLSGAMYKDVWYLPHGDSWAAQFIQDAGGQYLWSETKGSGSIDLNFEQVLVKVKLADFWIAPGSSESKAELLERNEHYAQFDAFKNGKIYNFAEKKGATGGLLYYELAPNRPDLILKDMIKIMHPEVLPDYDLYFYSKLN